MVNAQSTSTPASQNQFEQALGSERLAEYLQLEKEAADIKEKIAARLAK